MPGRAGQPQRTSVYRYYEDFSGGLNNLFNPCLLADNESPALQNVRFRAKGTISKRGGTTTRNGLGSLVGGQGGRGFYRKNGDRFLLYGNNGTLYKHTPPSTWDAPLKTGLSATNPFRFTTWRDNAYCVDGASAPFKTDGTTCTDLAGAPPVSDLIIHYSNHLFLVPSDNSSRVRFSDLDADDSWPALNFFDVNTDDGDRNTGFLVWRSRLVIWKERTLWQLFGDDVANFELDGPRSHYGAVSQESIRVLGDLLCFVAREGVILYDGGTALNISERLAGDWQRINQDFIHLACAYAKDDMYGFSVPVDGATANNRVFVFDMLRKAWSRDVGYAPAHFMLWAPGRRDKLFFQDATTGRVSEAELQAKNDDGVAVDAWYETKVHDFGLDTPKQFQAVRLNLTTQTGGCTVQVWTSLDRGAYEVLENFEAVAVTAVWDAAVWDESLWDEMTTAKSFAAAFFARGTQLSFRFRNDEVDQDFGVLRWGVFFTAMGAAPKTPT